MHAAVFLAEGGVLRPPQQLAQFAPLGFDGVDQFLFGFGGYVAYLCNGLYDRPDDRQIGIKGLLFVSYNFSGHGYSSYV